MTVALVAAQRVPIAWTFIFFTKVTPAVGMAWHLVRREWRAIAVVGLASLGIFVVSFTMGPGLWADWVALLLRSDYQQPFSVPLWIRLILAAILAVCGGITGRRWTIPIAVVVAHPAIWNNTLAIPLLWAAAALKERRRFVP